MGVKTFSILIAVAIFVSVIEMIRKQKMTFKYSLSWLSACVIVLFFAIYDNLLTKISSWIGFQLPSNFIFFLLLVFFAFSSLLLTLYINEQNNRSEALSQAVGILEYKIKKIQGEKKSD